MVDGPAGRGYGLFRPGDGHVAGPADMLLVRLCLLVFVAEQAREHPEIIQVRVAARAVVVPLALVLTRVDREEAVIVIDDGAAPVIDGVTVQASRGRARAGVRPIVIVLVAGDAVVLIERIVKQLASIDLKSVSVLILFCADMLCLS